MKQIAQAISILFHPMLLITLGAYFILHLDFIYHYALAEKTFRAYLIIILIGTFIIPVNAIFLIQRVMQKDLNFLMDRKEDRRLPLLITAIFVMLTLYLFSYRVGFKAPHLIRGYLIGSALSIVLASLVNTRFKISLHAMGLGGVLGLLLYLQSGAYTDLRPLIALWLIISGIVSWARLHLHAHNLVQIYTGYLTGLITIFLTVRL